MVALVASGVSQPKVSVARLPSSKPLMFVVPLMAAEPRRTFKFGCWSRYLSYRAARVCFSVAGLITSFFESLRVDQSCSQYHHQLSARAGVAWNIDSRTKRASVRMGSLIAVRAMIILQLQLIRRCGAFFL